MLEDLIKERKKKLELLKSEGIDPYPARVARTHTMGEALAKFSALAKSRRRISVAGRVVGFRDQGNLLFLDVADESGKLQAILTKENLTNFGLLKKTLDRGDFVSVAGPLFQTKRGEKSIEAREAAIIVKTLRPLPTEHFGIEDTETRLRERYLDLVLNPETKEMFNKKTKFWRAFREFLDSKGFLEVDTPGLEALPGGADAEPFKTHHNALDKDFYLRISLELPLKKLIVGGFEKIYEIGKVFRNEGIDREHLQDYTAIEFYWAYADYNDLRKLLEQLYKFVIKKVCGSLVTSFAGHKINWGKRWKIIDYSDIFKKENGFTLANAPIEKLYERARKIGLKPEKNLGRGRLIDVIYKKTVRPKLLQPCFLINTPLEVSPLAKRSEKNPDTAERIQMVACGTEIGVGWSELNDPLDQRARFEEQQRLRDAGDNEAQFLDEEYLIAMEYGMPPIAGFGGSERLFAVLMDRPIRETVFFPLMREKKE